MKFFWHRWCDFGFTSKWLCFHGLVNNRLSSEPLGFWVLFGALAEPMVERLYKSGTSIISTDKFMPKCSGWWVDVWWHYWHPRLRFGRGNPAVPKLVDHSGEHAKQSTTR